MVAAAECAELHATVAAGEFFEALAAKRQAAESVRQVARAPLPVGGHGFVQPGEQLGRGAFVSQQAGVGVESHGRHAAADVAADGRRVEQFAGGDDGADAHLAGQVHVGHERDVADIVGAPQPVDRRGDVGRQRLDEPSREGRQMGLTHRGASSLGSGPTMRNSRFGALRRVIAAATAQRSRPRWVASR
jgi:hypothetical protein